MMKKRILEKRIKELTRLLKEVCEVGEDVVLDIEISKSVKMVYADGEVHFLYCEGERFTDVMKLEGFKFNWSYLIIKKFIEAVRDNYFGVRELIKYKMKRS